LPSKGSFALESSAAEQSFIFSSFYLCSVKHCREAYTAAWCNSCGFIVIFASLSSATL